MHAGFPWHRQNDLTIDFGVPRAQFIHVHPHIDVGDHVPAAKILDVPASGKRIHGTKDQVAVDKGRGDLLPFCWVQLSMRVFVQTFDRTPRDLGLQSLSLHIRDRPANEPIEIAVGNSVVVVQREVLETKVRQLLNDV